MNDSDADKQLSVMHNWFINQSKNLAPYLRATMPTKKLRNN